MHASGQPLADCTRCCMGVSSPPPLPSVLVVTATRLDEPSPVIKSMHARMRCMGRGAGRAATATASHAALQEHSTPAQRQRVSSQVRGRGLCRLRLACRGVSTSFIETRTGCAMCTAIQLGRVAPGHWATGSGAPSDAAWHRSSMRRACRVQGTRTRACMRACRLTQRLALLDEAASDIQRRREERTGVGGALAKVRHRRPVADGPACQHSKAHLPLGWPRECLGLPGALKRGPSWTLDTCTRQQEAVRPASWVVLCFRSSDSARRHHTHRPELHTLLGPKLPESAWLPSLRVCACMCRCPQGVCLWGGPAAARRPW